MIHLKSGKIARRKLSLIAMVTVLVAGVLFAFAEASENQNQPVNNSAKDTVKINIKINEKNYTANLYNNAAVKAFVSRFPMTVAMKDLNGNEKYCYLNKNLSLSAGDNPGQIHAGDIMLYSKSCLVVFYKTFSANYKYVRLGRINDSSGLSSELGIGDITVTFSLAE